MANDFKQRVVNYQTNGDRLIIDEILYGAVMDFKNDPTREVTSLGASNVLVKVDLARPEYYIGYRVQRLKKGALREHLGEKLDATAKELNRLLSMVRIDFRVDFGGEEIEYRDGIIHYRQDAKLFAAVDACMDEIKREVYPSELPYFLEFYEYAKRKFEEREELRLEAEQGVDANIVAAIEHGLKYVDATKSEREIIVYMNMAITSKFGELELRRNGLKRIYRRNNIGDTVSLFVNKRFPKDNYAAIVPGLNAKKVEQLTKKQQETVDRLLSIIERDRQSGNLEGYSCDRRGNAIIKRDYAAEELGINYRNLRKTLSRIKKKSQTSVF